ncbi:MAG: TetR/AcrR family transcriptional regulator [Tabrizicola sp.]|jgi:AcrR family transcriptional regulator|nr:TetR/AcrR family transcriptional regulator [Tabrizicola sp.]
MEDRPEKDRKADLRTRLIEAAEAEIAEKGLLGLKARDVTQRAGCALGAIYNAVADLDELVMRVNSRTLERLGIALAPASDAGSSEAVTLALADAYAVFALENRRLWSALFEHRLPEGVEMPDWHRQEHEVLIARIVAPLRKLRPDLPDAEIRLRVRTLFGAVHGVVHLALQGRLVGVPEPQLRQEVAALVGALVIGAKMVRPGPS